MRFYILQVANLAARKNTEASNLVQIKSAHVLGRISFPTSMFHVWDLYVKIVVGWTGCQIYNYAISSSISWQTLWLFQMISIVISTYLLIYF